MAKEAIIAPEFHPAFARLVLYDDMAQAVIFFPAIFPTCARAVQRGHRFGKR